MTEESRKKGTIPEAKAKDLEESSIPFVQSAGNVKVERDNPILPSNHNEIYTPTVSGLVCDWNIQRAAKAVKRNKGAAGIDGVSVEEIDQALATQWPKIKQAILEGVYRPQPVKRVKIPKPDGNGVRQLGIPTVMDRIIQQAIHQEIVYTFEKLFSEYSYGFRPYRSAQQAVTQAHEYIQEGYEWVVDIDLEKFFDTVNHDMLMARIARHVKDKKILLLIRRYLQAGVMEDGLVKPTEEGTPQGGPLSPLLSNILLDDFDKELETRGHRFARYADDCNIYVRSEKAGLRVKESVTRFLTQKLKLKVNEQKSKVDNPWNRKFLGYTFTKEKGPNRITIHESRIKRFKDKIREQSRKMRGGNIKKVILREILPITRGWSNYFQLIGKAAVFDNLNGWIRRKIRAAMWRQWKRPSTRVKRLIAMGLSERIAKQTAYRHRGPWRMARSQGMHKALSNSIIESMGFTPMRLKMNGS